MCTCPPGIEYASTDPIQVRTTKNLCTYPSGIEYVGTYPILVRREEYKICAHILRELNR